MATHSIMNTCLEITHVIPTKKTVNLAVGDFIVKINDAPAIDYYHHQDVVFESYNYHIVSHRDSQNHVIESDVPIAIDFRPTKEAILNYLCEDYDPDWLLKLWETGDIKAYSQGFHSNKITIIDIVISYIFFRTNLRVNIFNTLFKGIDDYHKGNTKRAHILLTKFMEDVAPNFTMNMTALGSYYLVLTSEDPDEKAFYLDLAGEYITHNTLLSKKIAEHTSLPAEKSHIGTTFPTELEFTSLSDVKNLINLDERIANGEKPFTPICVMPFYRSNGPYSEIMHNHARMHKKFNGLINPIVILAGKEETSKKSRWYLDGEKLCQKMGVELLLLKDLEGYTSELLDQNRSPIFYIVDKKGLIVHEGLSTPFDYWTLYDIYRKNSTN